MNYSRFREFIHVILFTLKNGGFLYSVISPQLKCWDNESNVSNYFTRIFTELVAALPFESSCGNNNFLVTCLDFKCISPLDMYIVNELEIFEKIKKN